MGSRIKRAVKNASFELLLELVTAVCGFILPRLILSHYGSAYNGITSSISQFIGCITLLKSGIGSVTRAALYKPLAENNFDTISKVVNATDRFMKKIAMIFLGGVLFFSVIYPFIVKDDFEWFFSFSLVLILSLSTFAQYFFGITYQMVLEADQRNYVISIVNILSTTLNTIISAILILHGFGIHAVKLASAIVFVVPPIFYNIYVKEAYKIDRSVPPNYKLISERWDAFGHQLANFINTNTDIIIATIFLGVKEVSVYTVFYLVGNAIKKAIKAMGVGITAAFGNMLAKNEEEELRSSFKSYETMIFFLATLSTTIAMITIVPFINIYTKGVTDINYNRISFGYLVCIATFFECVKLPYQQMVYACGHFNRTKVGAYAEAAINVCTSLVMVNLWGLNGIVFGTIVALLFRTIHYSMYIYTSIIYLNKIDFLKNLAFACLTAVISILVSKVLPITEPTNYMNWVAQTLLISIIVLLISFVLGHAIFGKRLFDILS